MEKIKIPHIMVSFILITKQQIKGGNKEREFSSNHSHWEKLELIPTLFVGGVFVLKLKKKIVTSMQATGCEIRSLFIKSNKKHYPPSIVLKILDCMKRPKKLKD